jgi:hypothetical protein
MRLSLLSSLFVVTFGITFTPFSYGQEQAPVTVVASVDITARTKELMGKVVTVSGSIDKLEKDALSNTSFILVLEGNLRCRLSKEQFQAGNRSDSNSMKRKVELKSVTQGDFGLYINSVRYLNHGDDITIRGTLNKEMTKLVLDKSTIKSTSNPDLRSILRLSYYY